MVLAVVLAAVFVRLGFWQLDRRAERRARNDWVRRQLARPPASYVDLVRHSAVSAESTRLVVDSANAPWHRHVSVVGSPDFDHEFVVTGRSNNGSPGVHIFTPVRVEGVPRAVLVNRGWVYAPDAATIDLTRWREDRRTFTGYTAQIPWGHTISAVKGRTIRPLLYNGVLRVLPYQAEGLYVIARDSATNATPVRLPEPDLSDGPHLSYAIQWFCFAAIALIGAGIVLARSRQSRAG